MPYCWMKERLLTGFQAARTDDIILTEAGYNISPGQRWENALLEHPAVAECARCGRHPMLQAWYDCEGRSLYWRAAILGIVTMAQTLAWTSSSSISRRYISIRELFEFCDNSARRAGTGKVQRYRLRQQEQGSTHA